MIRKIIIGVAMLTIISTGLRADEGMWLPLLLREMNEPQMKKLGMKMSAEDVYSINKGSLKDAVVSFGGGCTGGVVSAQGLLLTNHHCGHGRIQALSTPEKNYLEDGFWAKSLSEELPSQGLFVTFIVRIEEVTQAVLAGVTAGAPEKERQSAIDKNLETVRGQVQKESWQSAFIRPFYEGNRYFLFVTETFNDIRFVGAPPESIGNFGDDTDNWVWPRHTGDFSVFRIYADKNNRPAAYSADNVPYRPKHFLPISLGGIKEGDFSLTYGFPGRTNLYLPASAVEMQVNVLNPIRTGIRDQILGIIGAAMRADAEVKLQYTSKQAGISNAWKKWIGETQGLKRVNGLEQKRRMEAEFKRRVAANAALNAKYGQILPELDRLYAELTPLGIHRDHFNESTRQIELFRLASMVDGALRFKETQGAEAAQKRSAQFIGAMKNYYKDYRVEVDRQLFELLIGIYFDKVPAAYQPQYAIDLYNKHGRSAAKLTETIYASTMLSSPNNGLALLETNWDKGLEELQNDPALKLYREIINTGNDKIMRPATEIQERITPLQRAYMQALIDVFPEKKMAPDANSTLRVSYGKVMGYRPRDAVRYEPMTYLDGVMEKYKPGDYEFDVPEKLRSLYAAKDYGQYADNGRMPVCFISTSHTTGGNSGSPTFDARGNLVGLLFDGAWEGVVSDYYFSDEINRSIIVDARYILFVIDKFGGAGHLVNEMKLVPGKGKR
ncbi:MAG TPA: S46 family peptidase [Saprospiraceae bacterium]|nr:S46 family peptidase [Saprospiraceae bacterium]